MLEVVQLNLLVVHLLEEFVVLDLQALALLGQVVHVLVQVFDLARQFARLSLEAFRGLLGGVLKRSDRSPSSSFKQLFLSPCPSAPGRWWRSAR